MLWNTQLIVSITIVEIDAADEWLGQAMQYRLRAIREPVIYVLADFAR